MADTLFPQEELDRIKQRETLTGVDSELQGAGVQELFGIQVDAFNPEERYNIRNKEEIKQLKQEVSDKSYELNHMDTGAYYMEQSSLRSAFDQEFPNKMTPEEANALTKEYNLDIKFDKDVSEGSVRYAVFEQVKKKQLAQEIADLKSEGYDYSWFENAGLALNGTYSWTEAGIDLTTMIGLAIATGVVGAAAEGVGSATKWTARVASIIKKAKEAENIARTVKAQKNVAKLATTIQRGGVLAKDIKDMSFLQRVGYDYYRLNKGITSPILRGGPVTPLVAAQLDAAISNIPTAILRSNQYAVSGEGEFKDAFLREEAMASAFGIALPLVGRGVRFLSKEQRGIGAVARDIQATLHKASVEDEMVGHMAAANAKREASKIVESSAQNISEALHPDMAGAYPKAAESFLSMNATVKEMEGNMAYFRKCVQDNVIPDLSSMPNMHMALSSVPSMKSFLDNAVQAGATNEDILRGLVNEGLVKLATEGKGVNVDGSLVRCSFENERGLLGRFAVAGLTEEDALNIITGLYRYHMSGDVGALEDVAYAYQKTIYARDRIRAILAGEDPENLLEDIITLNDLFKGDADQSYGSISERIYKAENEIAERGHSDMPLDELNQLRQSEKEMFDNAAGKLEEKEGGALALTDAAKEEYIKLLDDLERAVSENEELWNSDKAYENMFDSPEDFIARMNGADDIYSVAKGGETFEEMQKAKADGVYYSDVNRAARDVLSDTIGTMSEENLQAFADAQQALKRSIEQGQERTAQKRGEDLYTACKRTTEIIDEIYDKPMTDVSNKMMDGIKVAEEIQEVLKSGKELSVNKMKATLRGPAGHEIQGVLRDLIQTEIVDKIKAMVPEFTGRNLDIWGRVADFINNEDDAFAKELLSALGGAEEKGVTSVAKEAQNKSALDDLIEDVMTAARRELDIIQTKNFNDMTCMLKGWNGVVDAGVHADEAFHGLITSTVYNIDGSSVNIETLMNSDCINLKTNIEKRLRASERGTTPAEKAVNTKGEDLVSYYKSKDNATAIGEALWQLQQVVREHNITDSAEFEEVIGKNSLNSRDYRVAKAILDSFVDVQRKLDDIGMGARFMFRPYSSASLRHIDVLLPQGYTQKVINSGVSIGSKAPTELRTFLDYFRPKINEAYGEKGEKGVSWFRKKSLAREKIREANTKCYFLNALNFGDVKIKGVSVRDVQDAIVDGDNTFAWKKKGVKECLDYMQKKVDTLYKEIHGQYDNILEYYTGEDSFYLQDLAMKSIDIKPDYQSDFMSKFGHKDIPALVQEEAARVSNAYAVGASMGSKPKQMLDELIDMYKSYAGTPEFKKKWGEERAKQSLEGVENATGDLRHELKVACGNHIIPACAGSYFHKAIRGFMSPAMLINAGIKGFADEGYFHQYCINNAFMSRFDIESWAPIIKDLTRALQDPDIAKGLYMTSAFMEDSVMSSAAFRDATTPFLKTGLNDYASLGEKVQAMADRFSNAIFNFTLVKQITNFNRMRFTHTLYAAMGEKAKKSFMNLTADEQVLLGRHGIKETEWEILRKYCAKPLNEYIKDSPITDLYFLPDLVAEIPNDTLRDLMKKYNVYGAANKENISDALVHRYRTDLANKSGVLINNAVSESVTLPSIRTRVKLGAGWEGEQTGEFLELLKDITQFMSFGLQATNTHLKRIYAKDLDIQTSFVRNIIGDAFGQGTILKSGADFLTFMAYVGTVTALINEGLSVAQGKHIAWLTEDGEINPEKLKWVARQYAEPLGIFNLGVDAIANSISTGVTYVSVAPSLGALLKNARNIKTAATSEGTADNRAAAVSAAVARNLVGLTGVDRHLFTAALYNEAIGHTLEELSIGEDAYTRKMKRRQRQGYEPSLVESLGDYFFDR